MTRVLGKLLSTDAGMLSMNFLAESFAGAIMPSSGLVLQSGLC